MSSGTERAVRSFRAGLNIVLITMGLATGTFGLFLDFANAWFRVGLALFLYGWALRHIAIAAAHLDPVSYIAGHNTRPHGHPDGSGQFGFPLGRRP